MTWTYNMAVTADRDKVRFLAGDTDSAAAITLTNEEIGGALTLAGGIRSAAAECCDMLALRYAQRGQQLTDDIGQSVNYGDLAAFYRERARLLRSRAALAALPVAGGISVADKTSVESDDYRVPPAFTRTIQDAPATTATPASDLTRGW